MLKNHTVDLPKLYSFLLKKNPACLNLEARKSATSCLLEMDDNSLIWKNKQKSCQLEQTPKEKQKLTSVSILLKKKKRKEKIFLPQSSCHPRSNCSSSNQKQEEKKNYENKSEEKIERRRVKKKKSRFLSCFLSFSLTRKQLAREKNRSPSCQLNQPKLYFLEAFLTFDLRNREKQKNAVVTLLHPSLVSLPCHARVSDISIKKPRLSAIIIIQLILSAVHACKNPRLRPLFVDKSESDLLVFFASHSWICEMR